MTSLPTRRDAQEAAASMAAAGARNHAAGRPHLGNLCAATARVILAGAANRTHRDLERMRRLRAQRAEVARARAEHTGPGPVVVDLRSGPGERGKW